MLLSLRKTLTLLLATICPTLAADTSKYSQSITLSYEEISTTPQTVHSLCTVLYDPTTLRYTLSSWTPPSTDSLQSTSSEPTSAPLLRILLPNGSSTVTSLSTFSDDLDQHIALWLSPDAEGSIFSASVTSTTPPPLSKEEAELRAKAARLKARGKEVPTTKPSAKPKKAKKGEKAAPAKEEVSSRPKVQVTLIPAKPGPTPHLGSRAPPQVDAQGNEVPQTQQEEKSFFQKYWWVLAVAAAVSLIGGGGDK